MSIDGGTTTTLASSDVSGALATSIKINTEEVFEIIAVGEQSRSLLATIDQVNHQLETAKTLRRQKSGLLSKSEKENIEETFASTEQALEHVASSVKKSPGFRSRKHFVLRDSPQIVVSLTQLEITKRQLCTTITMLHVRQSTRLAEYDNNVGALERRPSPAYEESQTIAAVRQNNLRKWAWAIMLREVDGHAKPHVGLERDSLNVEDNRGSLNPENGLESCLQDDENAESRMTQQRDPDDASGGKRPHTNDRLQNRKAGSAKGAGKRRSRRWLESNPVSRTEYAARTRTRQLAGNPQEITRAQRSSQSLNGDQELREQREGRSKIDGSDSKSNFEITGHSSRLDDDEQDSQLGLTQGRSPVHPDQRQSFRTFEREHGPTMVGKHKDTNTSKPNDRMGNASAGSSQRHSQTLGSRPVDWVDAMSAFDSRVPLRADDKHENMPDLPKIHELSLGLEANKMLRQEARNADNHEQRDSRSRTTRLKDLSQTPDIDHDRHSGAAHLWLSHDTEIPPSQKDETDPWPDHIESEGGSFNFAKLYPEITELKDQYHRGLNVLSDSMAWNEWIDESLSQPQELEKKMGPQHDAAEETTGPDFIESGNGLKSIDGVHTALRTETELRDEERQQSRARARLVFSAAVDLLPPLTVGFLSLTPSLFFSIYWGKYVQGPPLWLSACHVLFLGTCVYTICLGLWGLCRLSQRAQESPSILRLHMAAQRALTAQITKLTRLCLGAIAGLLEAPVPMGMKRVRWQCTCGKSIHDDYVELKPASSDGAADEGASSSGVRLALERFKQAISRDNEPDRDRTRESSQDHIRTVMTARPQQRGETPNRQSTPTGVGHPFGNIGTSLKMKLMGSSSGVGSLPTHNPGNSVAKKSTALSTPRIPDHLEFLLLCVPFQKHANKLLNIDTTTPPSSDIAFFRLLRQKYAENRGRFRNIFSVRALSEIRFVQFEVLRNDLADLQEFDLVPPESQRDNYLYRPMPAIRKPPVGKDIMMHYYDHPEHAAELPVCFSKVPRKLKERLSAAPATGSSEGWGICFVEGVSWTRVCALGFVGFSASLIFAVSWTVVRGDIQGAFGVASYMLGALALGLGALQGALEM